MDEISYALENGKRVIPVIIKQCEIPFRLKRLQYIDFEPDYDEGFKRLSSVLNLHNQTTIAETPKIKEPIAEYKEEKVLPKKEFTEPAKVYTDDTNTFLQNDKPVQKKKSFKPLYFVAGGVILLVALFLIFNSHSSSGNQQVKNVDSTNVNSTNVDSIN